MSYPSAYISPPFVKKFFQHLFAIITIIFLHISDQQYYCSSVPNNLHIICWNIIAKKVHFTVIYLQSRSTNALVQLIVNTRKSNIGNLLIITYRKNIKFISISLDRSLYIPMISQVLYQRVFALVGLPPVVNEVHQKYRYSCQKICSYLPLLQNA